MHTQGTHRYTETQRNNNTSSYVNVNYIILTIVFQRSVKLNMLLNNSA